MKTLYDILGVDPKAKPEAIKKAYFTLAKKHHPDSSDKAEVKKFHEITEAYKKLMDKAERKAYDASLKAKEEVKLEPELEKRKVYETPRHKAPEGFDKHEAFRAKEKAIYRKKQLALAMFRTLAFSMVIGAVGMLVNFIAGGAVLMGFAAGVAMGFPLTVRLNFNVSSYARGKHQRHVVKAVGWLSFLGGLAYFVVSFI